MDIHSLGLLAGRDLRGRLVRADGQILVMFAVLVVAMVGMAALAIDVGNWYQDHRHDQNGSDAAALAGALSLRPDNLGVTWPLAQAAVSANLQNNGIDPLTTDVYNVSVYAPNDSVYVKAHSSQPSFFAQVFGVKSAAIQAAGTATVMTARGCSATGCAVVPWGVPDCSYASDGTLDCTHKLQTSYGQQVLLKSPSSTQGNFYGLRLPDWTGSSCNAAATGGGNTYRDEITGPWASSGLLVCGIWSTDAPPNYACTSPANASCLFDTLTGNQVGPTMQGLQNRICVTASDCNADTLASVIGSCDVTTTECPILKQSPRLLVVPVVRNADNTAGYQNGRQTIKIISLVYLFITTPGNQLQGQSVTGIFFRAVSPNDLQPGPYSGDGLVSIQLTS
jgi:Flp pilus assembly protein TadG